MVAFNCRYLRSFFSLNSIDADDGADPELESKRRENRVIEQQDHGDAGHQDHERAAVSRTQSS